MPSLAYVQMAGGQGSGVVVASDGNLSYILTAAHVVDAYDPEKKNFIVTYDGSIKISALRVYAVHPESDIALIVVRASLPALPVIDPPLIEHPGDEVPVIAAGFPMGAFPAIFSIGRLLTNQCEDHLHHSAGIWYGNSGGPLLDFNTLSVIGINVSIDAVEIPRYQSNRGRAVHPSVIREFMKKWIL